MEKNQQNQGNKHQIESAEQQAVGQRPGQQLPTGNQTDLDHPDSNADKREQHSEESFPKQDNETLGTP